MTTFTMTIAQTIYDSNEQFPINFDDAWQWLGYSRKNNAKRNLKQFSEGVDFCSQVSKNALDGRPSEMILLTIDCFKLLAMMAKTDLGRAARQYFLECEKIAKEAIAAKIAPENPNQCLWNEVCKSANHVSFSSERTIRGEGTHGEFATKTALATLNELNPTYNETVRESMFRSGLRLELEQPNSMIGEICCNIIVKQFRQTQIDREGVETVADHLLTKKELKDKQNALKNNPSSKEHLLTKRKPRVRIDNSKVDLKTLKNLPIEQLSLIQGTNNSPQLSLPEGFIIDIPLDNIH